MIKYKECYDTTCIYHKSDNICVFGDYTFKCAKEPPDDEVYISKEEMNHLTRHAGDITKQQNKNFILDNCNICRNSCLEKKDVLLLNLLFRNI